MGYDVGRRREASRVGVARVFAGRMPVIIVVTRHCIVTQVRQPEYSAESARRRRARGGRGHGTQAGIAGMKGPGCDDSESEV